MAPNVTRCSFTPSQASRNIESAVGHLAWISQAEIPPAPGTCLNLSAFAVRKRSFKSRMKTLKIYGSCVERHHVAAWVLCLQHCRQVHCLLPGTPSATGGNARVERDVIVVEPRPVAKPPTCLQPRHCQNNLLLCAIGFCLRMALKAHKALSHFEPLPIAETSALLIETSPHFSPSIRRQICPATAVAKPLAF